MSVGPDGHGWVGHNKDGTTVYMSDEELRVEREQRDADARRSEQLYVADDYQLFFLTKQLNAGVSAGRSAYISVKPFNVVPDGAVDEIRKSALPWDAASSQVRIEVKDQVLIFHDDITKTQSQIFIGELDPEVRQRLRAGQGGENTWNKLFSAAAASAPAVATKDDIAVHRPLTLRKAAPVL